MMSWYFFPRFSAILAASFLWKVVYSFEIAPFDANTKGVNEPCSTSIILWLKENFFSLTVFFKMVSVALFFYDDSKIRNANMKIGRLPSPEETLSFNI